MQELELLLPILTAFMIVLLSTPSFIQIAEIKHLFDDPSDHRKMAARKGYWRNKILNTLFTYYVFCRNER
jgi:hypothetical protein